MANPGMMRPLIGWQRANVLAAAEYVRGALAREPVDPKARTVYDGLMEVLEPARRTARQQREMVQTTMSTVPIRERRAGPDRRSGQDRRRATTEPSGGHDRRKGERRRGHDRRGD